MCEIRSEHSSLPPEFRSIPRTWVKSAYIPKETPPFESVGPAALPAGEVKTKLRDMRQYVNVRISDQEISLPISALLCDDCRDTIVSPRQSC